MVDVLLGLQWGDEGKGKIVDYLAADYHVIARFQGGPNAGHTLYVNGEKVVLRTIPSGIFNSQKLNLIGNGVVLDPVTLREEIEGLKKLGVVMHSNLFIAEKAHLILPTHRALDAASEASKGKEKIGSTLKGIGPAYMDKTGRNGLRVGDMMASNWQERYEVLKNKHISLLKMYDEVVDWQVWEKDFFEAIAYLQQLNIVNCEYWIQHQLESGKKILAEGAQGSMLDVDYGTYPFVTSSNTIAAGVCTGLGVAPTCIGEVYGITKAYCTRVGSGPFPTELQDEVGEKLGVEGNEFGAVTKRKRRCGWMDLVALRYTVMISGVSRLIITKADVLDAFEEIKVATAYSINGEETKQLPFDIVNQEITPIYKSFAGWQQPMATIKNGDQIPEDFQRFCDFVAEYLKVKVQYVSNGTGRDHLLQLF